jgi:hypothetical protein
VALGIEQPDSKRVRVHEFSPLWFKIRRGPGADRFGGWKDRQKTDQSVSKTLFHPIPGCFVYQYSKQPSAYRLAVVGPDVVKTLRLGISTV